MKKHKIIITIIVCFSLYLIYYFFIDTLRFSELTGRSSIPSANIFINLFDFDTGITRYELINLKKEMVKWQKTASEISKIQDPKIRSIENEKLLSEMMNNPAYKKLAQKLLGFGGKSALSILDILN